MVAVSLSSAKAVKTEQGKKTYGSAAARVADAGARAFAAAVAQGAPRFGGGQRNAMVRYFLLRASAEKSQTSTGC